MAKGAPINNRFWEARSKHGRDRIFQEPKAFWEGCCEYFEWCIDNPLIEEDFVVVGEGKGYSRVEKVERNKMRAFTIQGLCHFLGVNTNYLTDFKDSLKGKEDELSKDFSRVLTQAQETVYNQKFTGAASGFFNASLIGRDLGIAEKSEIKTTTINVTVEGEDGQE